MIRSLTVFLALLVPMTVARADIPRLSAVCSDGIEVRAEEGGPVWINGREAELRVSNPDYYQAELDDITVSLRMLPDGSVDVSYEREGGDGGVCPTGSSGL